ncbi:MAG: hypothetical protein METHP_00760 [Methanoregula sp. SKADARSKE-2]|nr:MAG: hypothetical protein METHP_00760 [Methanoregula sp. SKADARSKE-2]
MDPLTFVLFCEYFGTLNDREAHPFRYYPTMCAQLRIMSVMVWVRALCSRSFSSAKIFSLIYILII